MFKLRLIIVLFFLICSLSTVIAEDQTTLLDYGTISVLEFDGVYYNISLVGGLFESNEMLVDVNGYKGIITESETYDIGGLRFDALNIFMSDYPSFTLAGELSVSQSSLPPSFDCINISLDSSYTFDSSGTQIEIEFIGANSLKEVILKSNGLIKKGGEGDSLLFDGVSVLLEKVFVSNHMSNFSEICVDLSTSSANSSMGSNVYYLDSLSPLSFNEGGVDIDVNLNHVSSDGFNSALIEVNEVVYSLDEGVPRNFSGFSFNLGEVFLFDISKSKLGAYVTVLESSDNSSGLESDLVQLKINEPYSYSQGELIYQLEIVGANENSNRITLDINGHRKNLVAGDFMEVSGVKVEVVEVLIQSTNGLSASANLIISDVEVDYSGKVMFKLGEEKLVGTNGKTYSVEYLGYGFDVMTSEVSLFFYINGFLETVVSKAVMISDQVVSYNNTNYEDILNGLQLTIDWNENSAYLESGKVYVEIAGVSAPETFNSNSILYLRPNSVYSLEKYYEDLFLEVGDVSEWQDIYSGRYYSITVGDEETLIANGQLTEFKGIDLEIEKGHNLNSPAGSFILEAKIDGNDKNHFVGFNYLKSGKTKLVLQDGEEYKLEIKDDDMNIPSFKINNAVHEASYNSLIVEDDFVVYLSQISHSVYEEGERDNMLEYAVITETNKIDFEDYIRSRGVNITIPDNLFGGFFGYNESVVVVEDSHNYQVDNNSLIVSNDSIDEDNISQPNFEEFEEYMAEEVFEEDRGDQNSLENLRGLDEEQAIGNLERGEDLISPDEVDLESLDKKSNLGLIIILFGIGFIMVSLIGSYFFMHRTKKPALVTNNLTESAEKPNSEPAEGYLRADLDPVYNYIRNNLAAGYPRNAVIESLVEQGWNEAEIARVVDYYLQNP